MIREQDSRRRRKAPPSRIDPDALIIFGVKGYPGKDKAPEDAPVETATLVPGFFSKPLHERSGHQSLTQIVALHSEGAQSAGTTHHLIMTGENLSRILGGGARNPDEINLLKQIQAGSGNLRDSLGLPRRTNS